MKTTATQRYLSEFVGTMGLLLAVTGAAVFSAAFQVDFLSRVILISSSVGFALVGLIYAFGDLSGGHFNPAVTIGAWVSGRFPARDVAPYILAQAAGGVLGVGIIAGIAYGNSTTYAAIQGGALASQCYNTSAVTCFGYPIGSVFLIEVAFTFMLVSAILFATRPERTAPALAPLGIGLTLLMTNLVAIPVDGASINPARSFAPAAVSSVWSHGQWAIGQDWIFWVAPIVGGVLAAFLDRALSPKVE
jgi:aquaporin Z